MQLRRTAQFALVVSALTLVSTAYSHDAPGRPDGRVAHATAKCHERLDGALSDKGLALGNPIYVRLFKEEAQLEVWLEHGAKYELLKTYPICAHSGDLGPKERQGDRQAPEGFYNVDVRSWNPASNYHLAFDVGYPNAFDRANGRTGSQIMVHGDCVSIGCFAMTDDGIEEIYSLADAALAKGQRSLVHVFPFRMTGENPKKHGAEMASFWGDLKVGYDAFDANHVPPEMVVKAKAAIALPAEKPAVARLV